MPGSPLPGGSLTDPAHQQALERDLCKGVLGTAGKRDLRGPEDHPESTLLAPKGKPKLSLLAGHWLWERVLSGLEPSLQTPLPCPPLPARASASGENE